MFRLPGAPTKRRPVISRLLVLAGVLLHFADLPLTYYFGTLHSDYSRVRQFMSELAETGRPYSEVVRAWFFIDSLVLVGFGIGLARLVPRSRAAWAGVALYLVWAGLGVASAPFPCDPGCTGETFSGWMHRLIGEIMTVAILPVPTLIWLGVRHDRDWRGFGWIALPAQVLLVTATLALGGGYYLRPEVGGVALGEAAGLLQWLWWLALYGWNIALGLWVLKQGSGPGQGSRE